MNQNIHRTLFLACPLAASILLSSCIVPGYPADDYHASSSGSHRVYTALPGSFSGGAYYNDGRYYTGGRYQTGRYNYQGRQYTSRYDYNGQYVYGGRYQQYEPARPTSYRDRTYSEEEHSH
jgi:hypothetical protein